MRLLLVSLAAALAGCQTYYPTAQAHREVTIISERQVAGACLYLGQETVRAKGLRVGDSAIAAMKNRAAQRRGNLVVSDGPKFIMPGPTATMTGAVYSC